MNSDRAESKDKMQRQEVIDQLQAHREELKEMGVASLSLFGSVARDEANEKSDIDLLVEINKPIGLFGFAGIHIYLEKLFNGRKVDLVMPDAVYEELREDIFKESIRAV